MITKELLDRARYKVQSLVQDMRSAAETACIEQGHTAAADKLLSLSLAQTRLAEDISQEILTLKDTSWFWQRFAEQVMKPAFEMVLGSHPNAAPVEALYVRPWKEVVDALSQDMPVPAGSCLLLAQMDHVRHCLTPLWGKVLDLFFLQRSRAEQSKQAEAMAALAAAASASMPRSRFAALGGGQGRSIGASTFAAPAMAALRADLTVVDAAWKDKKPEERGCKWWSGMDGSCMLGVRCPDVASHVKGTPSPWHAARGKVFAQHGGEQDRLGNWVVPGGIVGSKRTAGDMTSTASSFQRSAA
jgi:hypothetical protein